MINADFNNVEELMKNFDFDTLFATQADVIPQAPFQEVRLTAAQREKMYREIDAKNKPRNFYGSYSCRYEKALITIAEKHNGEI